MYPLLIILMDIKVIEDSHLKLVWGLRRKVWKVQDEFQLIEDGDKIVTCISGGKDSYTMLDMLNNIQSSNKLSFQLIAVNPDQK